jgi:GT2 family glycosyltransferase
MASRDLRIALVVATSDRTREIRRMLASLSAQSSPPERIVVVDAGAVSAKGVVAEFPSLDIVYIESPVRSAARQRNIGVGAAGGSADLIGFADDDVEFGPDAFRAMKDFWRRAPADLGGAGFNMLNHPRLALRSLKFLPLARKLQLYDPEPGRVLRSGIQTLIGKVPADRDVEWLPTTAVIWRREVFASFRFDEWFDGYSYLEDLDFSYRVGKRYRLRVVAGAGYRHHPAPDGRGSGTVFGRREVLNRIHFVGKHAELSRGFCYEALVLRMLISFWNAAVHGSAYDLSRVGGNIRGLWESLWP